MNNQNTASALERLASQAARAEALMPKLNSPYVTSLLMGEAAVQRRAAQQAQFEFDMARALRILS